MSDALEARAFHLAGHAIMPMACGFEVEALCVHGFPGMGVATNAWTRARCCEALLMCPFGEPRNTAS